VSHDSKTSTAQPSDGIRMGRRAHYFVPTPEWVLVAGLSPQAQALYTVLLAHVNRERGDGIAWPGLAALADLLGYRKQHSVIPYVRELEALGAVEVVKETTERGRRNTYVVHETPPDGYAGARSLTAFYAREAQGQEGVCRSSGTSLCRCSGRPACRPSGTEPDERNHTK
jgi:hypothetical protein